MGRAPAICIREDALRRVRLGTLLVALMLAVSAIGAQAEVYGVPVLVMADDEDKDTVRRSSPIFKRAMVRFRDGLWRQGFRMIAEESVAMGLDLKFRDRRPRREAVELVELVRESSKVEYKASAMVLVRIRALVQERAREPARVRLRLDGDIYDTRVKRFVTRFDVPERVFPLFSPCLRNRACVEDFIGRLAEEAAPHLSRVVTAKLSRQLGLTAHRQPPVVHRYALILRHFEAREARTIIRVMAKEFPGYREHALLGSEGAVRQYAYVSSDEPEKIEEWLGILLVHYLRLKLDKDATIVVRGTEIVVEKLALTGDRPRSAIEEARVPQGGSNGKLASGPGRTSDGIPAAQQNRPCDGPRSLTHSDAIR